MFGWFERISRGGGRRDIMVKVNTQRNGKKLGIDVV